MNHYTSLLLVYGINWTELYVGLDVHSLYEASQEAVSHIHALHKVLQDTVQLPGGWHNAYSVNYAIGLLTSFLYSASRYSTVPASFHKLGLIFLDLFWHQKPQTYIILYVEVWFTQFKLNIQANLMVFYLT